MRFTSWFLVGASVKSTLHRYWPASAPPTSSMRSVAGKVSGRKWARAPTQWSKISNSIRKLLRKPQIFFAVYVVCKCQQYEQLISEKKLPFFLLKESLKIFWNSCISKWNFGFWITVPSHFSSDQMTDVDKASSMDVTSSSGPTSMLQKEDKRMIRYHVHSQGTTVLGI